MAKPSKKITELTDEQTAALGHIRDKWIGLGLSTQPADWEAAEAGVRAAYVAAGLDPPRFILRLASPWAGVVGQAVAPAYITGGHQVGDQVRAQVGDQVEAQVEAQVGAQVRAQVGAQVRAQVEAQVGAQVRAQVEAQVGDQVGAQVRAQVGARLKSWYNGYCGGNLWASYDAWAEAMEMIGVTGIEPLHGRRTVAANSCFWFVYQGFAIITDRPCRLLLDQLGRLHCEDGLAVGWRDGWGVYAWHGTRVPADLIEDGWPVEKILAEPNAEIRRCAIEKMGWDRFVIEAKLTTVSTADDPANVGHELVLCDVPAQVYGTPVRVLLCTNASPERDGTRRRFGLTVPASINDAVEAAAWSFGIEANEYRQLERAT